MRLAWTLVAAGLWACGARDAAPPDGPVAPAVDGAAPDGAQSMIDASRPIDAVAIIDAAAIVDAVAIIDAAAIADAKPMIDAVPPIDASAACLAVGPYGDFPDCSACTAAGRGCDEIDVPGGVNYHCDCGSSGDCPCGLDCGSREIGPGIFVSGICVR